MGFDVKKGLDVKENMAHDACLLQHEQVKGLFAPCGTLEERYQKLIALGRSLPPLDPAHFKPANEVPGCQSRMYLHSRLENGHIYFQAHSEALVSLGLAALLILAYNGLPPEVVLTHPPTFLEELQLDQTLTPNRANGLYSIHLKMKQQALHFLTQRT